MLKLNWFVIVILAVSFSIIAPAFGADSCDEVFKIDTVPFFNLGFRQDSNGNWRTKITDREGLAARLANGAFSIIFDRLVNAKEGSVVLNRLLDDQSERPYYLKLSDAFQLTVTYPAKVQNNIPKDGPVIFVANHPLSGIETVAIAKLVSEVRPDVKVVLNSLLQDIPGLAEHAILVNPFGGEAAKAYNTSKRLEMSAHLQAGGSLIIHPAGAVSAKETLKDPFSLDERWKRGVADLLAQNPNARVVPIFVEDEPSQTLHRTRSIHPLLAIPMIVREITTRVGHSMSLMIGRPLDSNHFSKLDNNAEVMAYLRARTYLMSDNHVNKLAAKNAHSRKEKIADPISPEVLKTELATLPVLYDMAPDKPNKGTIVYIARGNQAPNVLLEIGRLREIAFDAVGEGSGRARDNDVFDLHYYHLIAVDKAKGQISGGYRLALVDEILRDQGLAGVYTSQFFSYEGLLLGELRKSIELGRSFVTPEYQGGLTLPALWGGIGRFITMNPDYRNLIGGVSISNEFKENSKLILTQYLDQNHRHPLASQVKAMHPLRYRTLLTEADLQLLLKVHNDMDGVQELIRDIEADPTRKLPPLIPLYISLGARFLAFEKDVDFNTIDGLIWTDISNLPFATLKRYLGEEGARAYLEHWGKNIN